MPVLGLGMTVRLTPVATSVYPPTPNLVDLASGAITTTAGGTRTRKCPDGKITCPSDPEGWTIPPERAQCLEAVYDSALKLWRCTATGDRCGAEGYPPCVAPTSLWTYVESLDSGPQRVPADVHGQPIFAADDGSDDWSVDNLGVNPLYLLAGAGVLVLLLLGRNRS